MTTKHTLVLALAMIAPAAGRSAAQVALLMNRSVREELKVFPEQATKLDPLVRELMAMAGAASKKIRELPAEERPKASRESFPRLWADSRRKMAEALEPDQINRFDQIVVQSHGFGAFTTLPHVRERLKLTEDQVAKVLEAQEALDRAAGPRSTLQRRFLDDPEGMRKKWEEASKQATAKVVDAMTDEQKKTWADLNGPPFRIEYEPVPRP
jgi:hypothetical protein